MKKIISCRLCLFPLSKPTTSIKETFHNSNICISTVLLKIFPNFTKLQIETDSSCLPENICNICLDHLDSSYRFWKQCEQTNEVLLSILEEHKSLDKISLVDSNHSQYNLEHCEYYKHSSIKLNVEDIKEFIVNDSNIVNEIVIEEIEENNEDELDQQEEHESFFDYLRLKVTNQPLNNVNPKGLSWEEYFEANSTGLHQGAINNYKLDHNYCRKFNKYHCPLCHESFITNSILNLHFETYHNSSTCRCSKCGQLCLSQIDLLNHTRLKHSSYQCKICKKNYLSILKFEIHVKRNHNGYEPFECKLCPKSFVTKAHLTKHEKADHSSSVNKRLACQFCDRMFVSKGGLEWHIEVKHGPNIIHECINCLSVFSNSWTLMKHMKRHKGFKPFICVFCSKECPSMIHLQEHMKFKHETQSTYTCELCDITCFKESDLITHIQTHTGEM